MPKQKNIKNSKPIRVSFWGVRGSVDAHTKGNKLGGHTPCVSLFYDRRWLICDAGTGIRPLGLKLVKRNEPIAILLSHLHWDHIFGLPFFKPLYQKGRKIFLAGPSNQTHSFRKLFSQVMTPPFFPIRPDLWRAAISWHSMKEDKFKIGSVVVGAKRVTHLGKTFGLQFYFPGGKRVVYVTDQELRPSDPKFVRWVAKADLFIHDTQFDRREYQKKMGWGHSSFEVVLKAAIQAQVKKFVLFHHDPEASDSLLYKRLRWCQRRCQSSQSPMRCFLAKEGWTLTV